MPDEKAPEVERRVQAALKATIERNLARESQISEQVGRFPGVSFFSNGIIFSKSGNGVPFSNGIFFSKTGAQFPQEGDLTAEIQGLATFDQAAFAEFTDRLLRLKVVKGEAVSKHEE